MKPGCVHNSFFGLEVRCCCECPNGDDYAACVDFRQKYDGIKIKVEC